MSLFDKKYLVSPADALSGHNTLMPVATLHAVNGHLMINAPDGIEIAIFMMGCFWNVEHPFWQSPGVYSIVAIYTSGYTSNLIYREVCSGDTGRAEAARTVYDPSVISYEWLLQVLRENHDSAQGTHQGNDHDMQYRLAIYPLTPKQDAAACVSLEYLQVAILVVDDDRCITTEIASATSFCYAEDDHQQYLCKSPYGYCGIDGTGACSPSETQRYGYKCRLLIKCILFMPDTA